MALHFVLWCGVFSLLFSFSLQSQQINPSQQLIYESDEAKLKVAQLESVLDARIGRINAKTLYSKELEKDIQDTENQIQVLQSALSDSKGGSSSFDARIRELEEEVKLLWDALRKINFDLHVLEAKARDAEDRTEVIALEVQRMSDIVTERWIQIQHLEQMKEFNARRHLRPTRCAFLKLLNDLSENHLAKFCGTLEVYLLENKSSLNPYLSQALQQLKRFCALIKKYHHELQALIKRGMEKNEFTAALANREVVFFMASALITFPVLGAWMFCSS